MKLTIKPEANSIIKTLQACGYEAYAVGGCVRDALLGLEPHDWDVCTNASPAQMREVFRDFPTYDYGLRYGTLVVTAGEEPIEVTTYRVDGDYADNRRPEQVAFTDSLTLDLSRRDFTVNAMAYNDENGLADPFDGAEDLRRRLLRCVGEPDRRFNEDALRILRGVRFAAVHGFTVEEATAAAIHRNAPLLRHIAAERVRTELTGALCGRAVVPTLDRFRDVLAVAIPELQETFDFPQRTKHHQYDVWRHILHTVEAIDSDPLLRMTMLLHDIGKPRACTTDFDGSNHFKGHQQISAEMAEPILRWLRFPNRFIADCLALIVYHDVRFNGSPKQVKRVIQALGIENTRRLFKVQFADIAAQSDYLRSEKLFSVERARRQFEIIVAQQQCFSLRDLAVRGDDLLAAGIPKGRTIGAVLNALLNEVIDESLPNEKTALLERARQICDR